LVRVAFTKGEEKMRRKVVELVEESWKKIFSYKLRLDCGHEVVVHDEEWRVDGVRCKECKPVSLFTNKVVRTWIDGEWVETAEGRLLEE
jgi:ribosomal protein S17